MVRDYFEFFLRDAEWSLLYQINGNGLCIADQFMNLVVIDLRIVVGLSGLIDLDLDHFFLQPAGGDIRTARADI